MTEEQFEFSFMKNSINSIENLGYIGGQDEDLGGYCEPLIIEYSDGAKQYVLHSMWQSRKVLGFDSALGRTKYGGILNNYRKLLLPSKSELLEAWDEVRAHLGIIRKENWEKTDAVCGCDATPKEFYETKRKKLEGVA